VLQDPTKEGAAAGTCRASAPAATQQATQKIAAAKAAATACSERLCRKIYLAILHKQTVLQCSQVFCRPRIESHGKASASATHLMPAQTILCASSTVLGVAVRDHNHKKNENIMSENRGQLSGNIVHRCFLQNTTNLENVCG
jgi:hypothetical protein